MSSRDSSKSELAAGLLLWGAAAVAHLVSATGLYPLPDWLLTVSHAWIGVGAYHALKAGSTRFRRVWFDPRVRSVLALVAFAAAGGLYATGAKSTAAFAAFVGVIFGSGAVVESHERGSLRADPYFRLVVGLAGLGFVALAWILGTTYPYFGVAVMAATSAVTGLGCIAWAVRTTRRP
ncbi:hypothetical protein M0R88_05580 [Halorussus gelatinilyticus]|uniref:Uncharacterized protein n=1 Tax=Halorussus gelatinilyticus TaxID=2937524 RepID=A0A8U0IKE7_9EURY|nr:hypothetical protein [Halorussus gelatinilyticus]UPW01573.1 hypothetical protein M0R88_05580 [Halorussus gelatinilyticus]